MKERHDFRRDITCTCVFQSCGPCAKLEAYIHKGKCFNSPDLQSLFDLQSPCPTSHLSRPHGPVNKMTVGNTYFKKIP